MPHSPRLCMTAGCGCWNRGQGSLAYADLPNHTWHTVATLPGFTRGIDFAGPLAFIGLSQVRETAVFSGIPLVEKQKERICGVWVVNVQSGETVAFLRFESGVQEIFAVQIVPARFPELLEFGDELINTSYVLPDAAMKDVPAVLQETAPAAAPADAPPPDFVEMINRGAALLDGDRPAEAIALSSGRKPWPQTGPRSITTWATPPRPKTGCTTRWRSTGAPSASTPPWPTRI